MGHMYKVGIVIARAGLSEHQERELSKLLRSWDQYAGVYTIYCWGGSADSVLEGDTRFTTGGCFYEHRGATRPVEVTAAALTSCDEVYIFPCRVATLCKKDAPLLVGAALQERGFNQARTVSAWSNELRARS